MRPTNESTRSRPVSIDDFPADCDNNLSGLRSGALAGVFHGT